MSNYTVNIEIYERRAGWTFPLWPVDWDPAANKPTLRKVLWNPVSRNVTIYWDEGAPEHNSDGFRVYKSADGQNWTLAAELSYDVRQWGEGPLNYGGTYWYRIVEYITFLGEKESVPLQIRFMPRLLTENVVVTDALVKKPHKRQWETQRLYWVLRKPPALTIEAGWEEWQPTADSVGVAGPVLRVSTGETQVIEEAFSRRAEFRRAFAETTGQRAVPQLPGGSGWYTFDRPNARDVSIYLVVLRRRVRLETLNVKEGFVVTGKRPRRG